MFFCQRSCKHNVIYTSTRPCNTKRKKKEGLGNSGRTPAFLLLGVREEENEDDEFWHEGFAVFWSSFGESGFDFGLDLLAKEESWKGFWGGKGRKDDEL